MAAWHSAGDDALERRVPDELDLVARIGRAERDGQLQVRDFLAVVERPRDLVHAHDAPARDGESLALHVFVALDGVDVLVHLVHLEAHAERGQRRRLHQPDVPDGAVVDAAVELLLVHPRADLPLELQPPRARVHDPPGLDAIDPAHHVPERGGQPVEHEAGVHPGPEQRHLPPLGDPIEPLRDLGMAEPGVRELLTGGDHREPGGERLRQLALDAVQAAAGRVQQDSALRLLQRRPGVRRDRHVGSRRVEHVGQLAPDALRIEVHRGDDL